MDANIPTNHKTNSNIHHFNNNKLVLRLGEPE